MRVTTRDLFDEERSRPRAERSPAPPEIVRARSLARRMKRLAARPDKVRCAHLICQNLIALLSKKS